ncbi:ATP-grasp domain-containing protein [Nocardiopsis sp. HNM0947]|uniref:ATP-grasp domain-containing protein n=1 Tax=Nocardiopsis coralli TaxID=2772213 RepID=A0ABR9PCK4_9ACTN|nr:ATP-grasp domain-containing protein [Nocardiopsis coralli]MBE3001563.1 ATP-grasp domain-containing protein [Nocardiopsis coralli]
MTKNVFVLGLDEHNRQELSALPGDHRIHPLLDLESLTSGELDMPALLERAEQQLQAFDGTVDAVIGYWDFPVSSLVPLLCEPRGLPHAPLDAIVRCEHKYWSRLEQRSVVPEAVPRFAEVDLDEPGPPQELRYPLWLKPVKAFSSELAFRVTDDEGYHHALQRLREGAGRVGAPFQWVMDRLDLPEAIARAGGTAGLAEEEATGRQITVEGYVHGSRPHIYGIVDSDCYPGTSSFLCYEYPSRQSTRVRERVTELTRRVIAHMGLDNTAFNVEYFHDADQDTLTLLEINPRHSQSHAALFESVDGLANHEAPLRIALGEEPRQGRGGQYPFAAKWFLRRFRDGLVRSVPTSDEIERIEHEHPGVHIEITARAGLHLSELGGQDTSSYELADVFVGADGPKEAEETYRACADALDFDIQDTDAKTTPGD